MVILTLSDSAGCDRIGIEKERANGDAVLPAHRGCIRTDGVAGDGYRQPLCKTLEAKPPNRRRYIVVTVLVT